MKISRVIGITALAFGTGIGLPSLALRAENGNLNRCNTGDLTACSLAVENHKAQITNKAFLKGLAKTEDAKRQRQAQAQAEKDRAAAEFKAQGWREQEPGIFVRWCDGDDQPCAPTETYMDVVWRMEVWCKERACGDIYARINIQDGQSGPVLGWTNATGYGDIGQKVILTFQSSTSGSARITEFIARG
jgi:hypothetical protein